MNKKDFYKEIGNIDEDLIIEAEAIKKHNFKYRSLVKWCSLTAACFAVIICAIFFIKHGKFALPKDLTKHQGDTQTYSVLSKYKLTLNKAAGQFADKIYIEGHFWQELSNSEISSVFKKLPEMYQIKATANFSKKDNRITLFNIDATVTVNEKLTAKLQAAPDKITNCYELDAEPKLSEIAGIPVELGYFDKTNNGKTVYYAHFKIDDVAYYIELAGNKQDEELFVKLVEQTILEGKADFSKLNPIVPELRDEKLTLKEAYTDKDYGMYLPKKLPDGFVLESAKRFINQNSDYLMALWFKGMNEIYFKVSNYSNDDAKRLTTISDTKNYDLSLYPIPQADSVPIELRDILDNPIFRIDELTLEAVKRRAYTINDSGDSASGSRMRFSVLYGDKILVEINAKGVESEFIFDQLVDIIKR